MVDDVATATDGRRLAWLEVGDPFGVPVMHNHGAPTSRLEVQRYDAFGREHGVRLIGIDRPGYGRSDPRPGRRFEDWPADVAAVADALGVGRFFTTGISSGGPYAVVVAAALGDRVRGAGVLCGVGDFGRAGAMEGYWPEELVLMRLAKSDPTSLLAQLDRLGETVRADPLAFLSDRIGGHIRRDVARAFADNLAEAFRQGGVGYAEDLTAQALPWTFDVSAIDVPVLVWHGDVDEMVPLHHALDTADRIPTGRLRVLPGLTHLPTAWLLGELVACLIDEVSD
ncbi:MAG: alpha/beta fold hydrolase [Acidimicrobiia bacterium]